MVTFTPPRLRRVLPSSGNLSEAGMSGALGAAEARRRAGLRRSLPLSLVSVAKLRRLSLHTWSSDHAGVATTPPWSLPRRPALPVLECSFLSKCGPAHAVEFASDLSGASWASHDAFHLSGGGCWRVGLGLLRWWIRAHFWPPSCVVSHFLFAECV